MKPVDWLLNSFADAGVYRVRDDLALVQTLDFYPGRDDPHLFGQLPPLMPYRMFMPWEHSCGWL